MRKISTFLWTLLLLFAPLFLLGSTVKSGENVTIDKPVEGNLYVAGGEIYTNAAIRGDFIAAGGKIFVKDSVGDEGLVAGGEISIESPVMGDLRIAGGQVTIRGNITGDLVIMGGEVRVAPEAQIGGDLIMMGGEVDIGASIKGQIRVSAGELTFRGNATGPLNIKGGEITIDGTVRGPSTLSAQNLKLGSQAGFYADVRYWQAEGEMDFGGHLKEGAKATYDPALKSDLAQFDFDELRRGLFWFSIYRFLAGILLIVLLITFFHPFFSRHAGQLTDDMGSSLGYGALYLIGIPVLAVLAFITVIGIPVGFILTAGYSITLALAGALVATVMAYEVERYLGKDWGKGVMMLVAVGISLLLRLVGYIPLVGGIVMVLLIAVVFGYLYKNIRREGRLRRQAAAASEDIV